MSTHRSPLTASTLHGLPLLLAVVIASAPAHPAQAGVEEHLAVVSTDFSTSGSFSTTSLSQPFDPQVDIESVGADPIVRAFGDRIYVVNRFGSDAVQVIDAGTHDTVLEFSVGATSNPQDIALVNPSTAYVTRLASQWLYRVNPATGAILDSVDLGGFADADGYPEMAYMALDGDHLFVQLQRLNTEGSYNPVPPSYLAVVDVTTNTLVDVDPVADGVQAIQLTATNPHQKMQLDVESHRLYVSEIAAFGDRLGGVEVVDTQSFQALGMVLTEATVGADVSTPVILSPTKGYVLTSSDFFFTTSVTAFNPSTGTVTGTLFTTSSFTSALVHDEATGSLFLADQLTTAPGVRVFDTTTDTQITTSPIDVGLPPVDLAIVRPALVDVPVSTPPVASGMHAVPNPFTSSTTLRATVADVSGAARWFDVFDASGRHVRRLVAHAAGGGLAATWDGADASGRTLAPGVYTYRASRGQVGRVVRLR